MRECAAYPSVPARVGVGSPDYHQAPTDPGGTLDSAPMDIRLMHPADLDAVQRVQRSCYPVPYHEPPASFGNKLRHAPDSCWVIEAGGRVEAYLVCLPADETRLPGLHATDWCAPRQPSLLYLHDLAVSPGLRGQGAAQALIDRARAHAAQAGLRCLALVAVQGSEPYWARQGFAPREPVRSELVRALHSFGDGARFMVCAPGQAGPGLF